MSRKFPQALFSVLIALFITGHLSATTYYVAASGSDSNNGTSTTTPWLHAPGMSTCTATCASTTIKPGTRLFSTVVTRGTSATAA